MSQIHGDLPIARFPSYRAVPAAPTCGWATDDEGDVKAAARQCLDRIELRRPVRLLGVRLTNLERPGRERAQ